MSRELTSNPIAFSPEELARRLAVSRRHIYRMNSSGKLPRPIRLGRSVRWILPEINAWLQAGAPDRKTWDLVKENKL